MVRPHNRPGPEELKGRGDAGNKDARKVRPQGKLVKSFSRYVVTPSLRSELKKPVGTLFSEEELMGPEFLRSLLSSRFVVSVGDRVTETLYAMGRTPEVQVIDGVERRVKRPAPNVPFAVLHKAPNAAGTITLKAVQAVRAAIEGAKPARVMIDGEEDLLAIPAIEWAPEGSSLYYGQPGEGVVVVSVDERSRSSAKIILARMKRE